MNPEQLLEHVIRPTLNYLGCGGWAAEQLVLGTAAVESGFSALRQYGGGPAMGIYQMEPASESDIHQNFLRYKDDLRRKVDKMVIRGASPHMDNLIGNLFYATAMCRLQYYRQPYALPPAGDIDALGAYWKRFYNTHLGAGTKEKFVNSWDYFSLIRLF